VAVDLPENVLIGKLDHLANWVRANSLWPMPFATACCGIELMATGASRHDLARFGAEVMRFSPRQCDLMIVAGRVVMKMLPVLQRIWLQMPEPKWCISMGACASSGGVFDTYAVVQGVDRFIPVDIYVPGCPPRPEQLIQSLLDLQDRIRQTGTLQGREFIRRTEPTGPMPVDVLPTEAVVAPGDYRTATRQWQEPDIRTNGLGLKTTFPEAQPDGQAAPQDGERMPR
jgi:NADH-quinone oxidoreductase subunit B